MKTHLLIHLQVAIKMLFIYIHCGCEMGTQSIQVAMTSTDTLGANVSLIADCCCFKNTVLALVFCLNYAKNVAL